MPNSGYPDNDGSRTASGQHDEGRQRASMDDYASDVLQPTSLLKMQSNADSKNNRSDSSGNSSVPNFRWSLDGVASAGTAAYPPKPEDPNAKD